MVAIVCLLAAVGTLSGDAAGGTTLASELDNAVFYNNGTARATDQYVWLAQKVSYNEPDNVTCTGCRWSVGGSWHYLWQKNNTAPPPSPATCNVSIIGQDLDVRGNDMFEVGGGTLESCQAACCADLQCAGALFEPASAVDYGKCVKGSPCCFLKTSVATSVPLKGTHGTLFRARASGGDGGDDVIPPPMGLRSAPALGGIGAGSVELRSDGTFRDWTILNQGPAGSGKYGVVDDVWMAARVNSGPAKILRTQPPNSANGSGVDALTFSGSYPLTRLAVNDPSLTGPDVNLEVYGYSTLKPTDLAASATPALVLTLKVTNKGTAAATADFMLTLPFGAWTDCSYSGSTGSKVPTATTHIQCMEGCTGTCASWEFTNGVCTHNTDVPLTAHAVGSYCGVRGTDGWTVGGSDELTWTQRPIGAGPSIGDVTLRPVGTLAPPPAGRTQFGASNDPAALFAQFDAHGSFDQSSGPGAGAVAAHGAVSGTIAVPAGASETVSIVFAWYFPDRNYKANKDPSQYGLILGNYYQNLFASSSAVAATLATDAQLQAVLADINTHHHAVAHPNNPAPDWLKDMLLNQFSHYHMFMWYKDGRMREYEAWSCDDVDSVHNDYQRHLLYLWSFKEFEVQKVEAWGTWAQDPQDGHVYECLAGFGHGPLDKPTGRYMGDTSTLYVLELFELYRHTGNLSFVKVNWKSATNALSWCINNANASTNGTAPYGLPQHLTTTYDHFRFEEHRAVTYNAHIYLTALTAGRELAAAVGDTAMQGVIDSALALSTKGIVDDRLWNASHQFFRCHTCEGEANPCPNGENQVFTDSLYGQMLAHHHFGNFTIDSSYLESHLAYEWEQNQDTYGMRVLSNPVQEDSIWMNGPPTWSYLQLALGKMPQAQALEPFKRMSENFRTRLRDQWNLRALTHTDGSIAPAETTRPIELGAPREQGHYGFMLTDLYLYPLLSGQAVDMPNGKLSFKPMFPAPYVLPVLIAGVEGTLAREAGSKQYTLTVAFGSLKLPAGGLSADGVVCNQAVELSESQSVTWGA